MNILNRIFLKAKHWQLFIFFFILPCILAITGIIIFLGQSPFNTEIRVSMGFPGWFHGVSAGFNIIIYLWMLTVALGTRKLAPAEARKKTGFFIFSVIYSSLISVLMVWGQTSLMLTIGAMNETGIANPALILAIAIPLMILSMFGVFCALYTIYYAARAYKSAELQRPAKFEDCIAECVFFIFSFIGVWVLQPKINRMAGDIIAVNGSRES